MNTAKYLRIPAALLLALALVGCQDTSLQKAAKAIEGAAVVNDALAKTIIAEQQTGTITEADARTILNDVCARVAGAVSLTADVTKQYSEFPPGAKPKLAPLLQPILDALNTALNTGLIGIKSPQTLTNVRNSLLTIQTAMLAAQAAMGGQ